MLKDIRPHLYQKLPFDSFSDIRAIMVLPGNDILPQTLTQSIGNKLISGPQLFTIWQPPIIRNMAAPLIEQDKFTLQAYSAFAKKLDARAHIFTDDTRSQFKDIPVRLMEPYFDGLNQSAKKYGITTSPLSQIYKENNFSAEQFMNRGRGDLRATATNAQDFLIQRMKNQSIMNGISIERPEAKRKGFDLAALLAGQRSLMLPKISKIYEEDCVHLSFDSTELSAFIGEAVYLYSRSNKNVCRETPPWL